MSVDRTNEIWASEFFQKHTRAALDHYLQDARESYLNLLHLNMRHCESPLEAAFLAQWMALACERSDDDLDYRIQSEVVANDTTYRLDVTYSAHKFGWFGPLCGHRFEPKVAVELDGHDFHEKTKEQVTYRNRRDRDLQTAGWIVLHLSGSEFHRNPYKATEDVWNAVREPFFKAMHVLRDTA